MLVFELKGNFEQFGYKFRYKFITKPFNAFSLILAKWLPCCSFDDSCAGQFLRVFYVNAASCFDHMFDHFHCLFYFFRFLMQ